MRNPSQEEWNELGKQWYTTPLGILGIVLFVAHYVVDGLLGSTAGWVVLLGAFVAWGGLVYRWAHDNDIA